MYHPDITKQKTPLSKRNGALQFNHGNLQKIFSWLKCEQYIFEYQNIDLDVKLIIGEFHHYIGRSGFAEG